MTNLRKLGLIVSTTAGLAAPALAQTSVADGFEGWCQPTWYAYEGTAPEGHFSAYEYGSVVRLDGFSQSTGEEGDFCQFSNPTAVQGFDAVFLDAQCNGPSWIPGVTSDTPPDRVMLMSASGDRFTGPEASMIMPSNIVELAPCLSYHYSDMHSELGYEPGFRVPEPDSSDARYLAEILNPRWGSGGTFIDGRLQEAVGMEPNFAGRYIIGAMGGCGTDCSIPFFFDTRDGRAIELTLSDDPYAEYANFSFSMISDSGGMIVSWRDGDCVRQEFAPVGNSFELIRETRTPYDLSLWSGYPLHCPTTGAVSEDVGDLTADVAAALGVGSSSELAPLASLRPQTRPNNTSDRAVTPERSSGWGPSMTAFDASRNCANNRPVGYGGSLTIVQCIGYLRFMSETVHDTYEPQLYDEGFIQGAHLVDQLCRYDDGYDQTIDFKLAAGSMNAIAITMEQRVDTMELVLNSCSSMLRAARAN